MTISEVEKYRYWADEHGQIWERKSYCLEPTVEFEKLTHMRPWEEHGPTLIGGAINCLNVQGLRPIEMPVFDKDSE